MIFKLNKIENEAVMNWIEKHNAEGCKLHDLTEQSAIDVKSYTFTPTIEGCFVEVKCACGASYDVTDYSDW